MDLFPEACLVRDMQKELDAIIQQGVFQLTRLLKNSETGVSSGSSAAPDEDGFTLTRQKQNYLREAPKKVALGRGRLTERLLAQGLITPNMLQELKKEWTQQTRDDADSDDDPVGKKTRRKRKK